MKQPNLTIITIYNASVFIKGTSDINPIISLLKSLPPILFSETDRIYIHDTSNLKDFDSIYTHGIVEIDLSSVADSKQLGKLLVHELFHSLEDTIQDPQGSFFVLFSDVQREFKEKKIQLLQALQRDSTIAEKPKKEFFETTEFSKEFDDYLHKTITYPILQFRIGNLFASPYAITSLSEYMCTGLEVYLFENREWLRANCAALFFLIEKLLSSQPQRKK